MNYEGPGIYRHYKGGHYRVIGLARHEATGAKLVVYHSYSLEHDIDRWMQGIDFVARPLNSEDGKDAFNESVTTDFGSSFVPRFDKLMTDDVLSA